MPLPGALAWPEAAVPPATGTLARDVERPLSEIAASAKSLEDEISRLYSRRSAARAPRGGGTIELQANSRIERPWAKHRSRALRSGSVGAMDRATSLASPLSSTWSSWFCAIDWELPSCLTKFALPRLTSTLSLSASRLKVALAPFPRRYGPRSRRSMPFVPSRLEPTLISPKGLEVLGLLAEVEPEHRVLVDVEARAIVEVDRCLGERRRPQRVRIVDRAVVPHPLPAQAARRLARRGKLLENHGAEGLSLEPRRVRVNVHDEERHEAGRSEKDRGADREVTSRGNSYLISSLSTSTAASGGTMPRYFRSSARVAGPSSPFIFTTA